ncbi:MAG: ribose 5-phosphate isomerase A [Phycisphaerales bacterium]|nr:ribose 5-phosphate isomerase A [Phycisphaerales bacterium]
MSDQHAADALAQTAVGLVANKMIVGLGAGKTASRGILALAERVNEEALDIQCVAASQHAEDYARQLGLRIIDFGELEEVDILIDGADEIDRTMSVMKGSRGAMTRERILCWASNLTVFMVHADKIAESQIGIRCPLPIAVMPYGLASTRIALRHIGINGVIRPDHNGGQFVTDNNNFVLDAVLRGDEDLAQLASELNDIPGVIDHGLFIDEADLILIEHEDRDIEHLER